MTPRLPRFSRPCAAAIVALLGALLAACAPLPPQSEQPRTTLAVKRIASPSFDQRRPNLVLLHHTGSDAATRGLRTLTAPERKVSAHYLIGRDGVIYQLVEENARAWHAGVSWWGGTTDINSASLGIELDNNGNEPFADAQIDALLALLADIGARYAIPGANVIGHADVAPTRKADPSLHFPWKRLADAGFGLWCDAPPASAPPGFDLALALTALGYDPAIPEAARAAFRLHFVQDRPATEEEEKALAYCLLQKKAEAAPF